MRQRLSRNSLLQGLPVETLHRNELLAVLLPDFVDGADVRVVQARCGIGLPLEAAKCLRVSGYIIGKEFQGDEAIEPCVLRFVDNTHPAATKLFNHAIVGNRLPGEWRGIGHWREFYSAPNDRSTRRLRSAAGPGRVNSTWDGLHRDDLRGTKNGA